jgi:hypothetical protein
MPTPFDPNGYFDRLPYFMQRTEREAVERHELIRVFSQREYPKAKRHSLFKRLITKIRTAISSRT